MKSIITAAAVILACAFSSCTTHEYPAPTTTTVYVPAKPKPAPKAKVRVKVDSPETTTVVRPEE